MVEQTGSTPLFAVFLIAIYSLLLIGYTCYKLCAAASPDEVVKPWEAVSDHWRSSPAHKLWKELNLHNIGLSCSQNKHGNPMPKCCCHIGTFMLCSPSCLLDHL